MPDYYRLVPHTDHRRHSSNVTSILVDGKEMTADVPVQLTAAQRDELQEKGFVLEKVSKTEAKEAEAENVQGGGLDPSGPVLGDLEADESNQAQAQEERQGADDK